MTKTATKKSTKRRPSTKSLKKVAAPIADESEVQIDRRRGSRRDDEPESAEVAEVADAPKLERRKKVNRRRQIDPTTCERDYTDQEVEFMNALDDYKRKSGRMFPTCSEVLEVIHSLGYVKLSASQMLTAPANNPSTASAKPMPQDLQTSADGVSQLVAEELWV